MKTRSVLGLMVLLITWSCSDSKEEEIEEFQKPEKPVELIAPWTWEELESPTQEHIRGLCVVNDSLVWISGTGGSVFRTSNGGKYWDNLTLPGCDSLDFRDIHAFDEETAFVMSAGYGVVIFGTNDGGMVWNELYKDTNSSAFFDGFDFWDKQEALAYGDPVNGKMPLLKLRSGWIWKEQGGGLPKMQEGEAGFAASGTGIVIHENHVWIATGGGKVARVLHSSDSGLTWNAAETPMVSGEGAGIFSIAFKDSQIGIAVGGDYVDSTNTQGNAAYTVDGGTTWLQPDTVPLGYRSCVAFSNDGKWGVAVGRTGCEWTLDDGNTWEHFSDEGYWVCDFGEQYLWASGRAGKLARLKMP